jgi:outer membrane protein OmpA-like peptidoglycan-associated protein
MGQHTSRIVGLGGFAAAFGIFAAPTIAAAQEVARPPAAPGFMEGFDMGHPFVGIAGGPTLLQDVSVNPVDGPYGPGPAKERYNLGYIGAGAAGYAFSNGLQVDVLGAYEHNSLNNLVPVPVPGKQTGFQESYGAFLETAYAFKMTDFGIPITFFSPYIGVGAGALYTHEPSPEFLSNGDVHYIHGTSGPNFAYEGIVGAAIPIASVPGLALTTDYRIVGIHDAGALDSTFYNAVAGRTVRGAIGLQKDIFVHVLTFGVAYAFGVTAPSAPQAAPPPPPMVAPALIPARTYLVFFDWDRADLSMRGRQIVAEAATASTHVQTTRISVNGYTDLSGTAKYNLALSVRRATSVQAELVRDGVPPTEIAIKGFGESNPLVPTAAGVREPQNRRVEIILN